MKKIIILMFLLILIPLVLGINLKVEKVSSNEVLIKDSGKPAVFDVQIKNLGQEDNFLFYSYFGTSFHPKGTVHIDSGETKNVKIEVYGLDEKLKAEHLIFDYFIKSQDGSEQKESLTIRISELKDAFEITSSGLDPEANTVDISVKNNFNYDFENLSGTFSSPFFEINKDFSLSPYGEKIFSVQVDKQDFKKLLAGFYTLESEITYRDLNTEIESTIKFIEKEVIKTTESETGFIISTKTINKENKGNIEATSNIVIQKNIVSRLFTTFNIQPDITDREGTKIYYSWNREIKPGEQLEISIQTNWIFPLLVIFLIVLITIMIKTFSGRNLVIRKKLQFVRTKGGEFGLKVSLIVNAKRFVEKVTLTDRLPNLVKIYERFSGEQPNKVDEKNKRIEWNFEKLDAGEKRMVSYIIYSKVGVLGKFALPNARAIYERDGKLKEAESNKAFFVSEQSKKDLE